MEKRTCGFTLIELLVVIGIIAILAAILLPVFASARLKGEQIACVSNAHEISVALLQYVQDNDECFMQQADNDAGDPNGPDPNAADFQAWYDVIQPYAKNYAILQCPSFRGHLPIADWWGTPNIYFRSNYAISYHVLGAQIHGLLAKIPNPSQTLLVAETATGIDSFADFWPTATGPDFLMASGANHFVQAEAGTDDFGDPAIKAQVTGIAVDGHVVAMPMNNLNGGGVTMTPDGRIHDPAGGWKGLYITGPDGELTIQ